MTGAERIEAAFGPQGTTHTPVVVCYEGILVRDHWRQITDLPWWHHQSPDIDRQLAWLADYCRRVEQDWTSVSPFYSRPDREALSVERRGDGVCLVDRRTGRATPIDQPQVGGWDRAAVCPDAEPPTGNDTPESIERAVPAPEPFDAAAFEASGRGDLARALLAGPAHGRLALGGVGAPMWQCYSLWGFAGLMRRVAERPDLVRQACDRLLRVAGRRVQEAAAIGARAIWIEECFTDAISPAAFEAINLPVMRRLVKAVRAAGMKSIYYYTGNPWDRLDTILAVGADALAVEETKKGFTIDIAELARRAAGRCVLFGNLDAVGVLQHATDAALRGEIARQLDAGQANGGRFVMSLGSPVTPDTPVERVARYCQFVRELCS